MNKILVLGAGLVSRPGVNYLLRDNRLKVTVASRTLDKAESLVKNHKNGHACQIDVEDQSKLDRLIADYDIVISLLPWIYHVRVAQSCLQQGKHMATTSYVSGPMRELHQEVKKKRLLFLNEMGVDPGIDHMSAMKIIDQIRAEKGKVLHFYSFCGGLPAPDNNDNPFGYKFSWSPRGVVLASRNPAQFLENGEIVKIEGKDLFLNYRLEEVEGLGQFEVYPNRDSLPYREFYRLDNALTVMRGTYRNLGWCQTLKKMVDLGLLNEEPVPGIEGMTFRELMSHLLSDGDGVNSIEQRAAKRLGITVQSEIIQRLAWLGLFAEQKVPFYNNVLDIICHQMLEKLKYREGEKDMILLKHRFVVENKDKSIDLITSTLIDYGIPFGDTSMARTVSLPLAIGVKLMAEEKIPMYGVVIPTEKEIYEPVLNELDGLDIKMVEKRIPFPGQ